MLKLYGYPKCSTCQKAQKWLDRKWIEYDYIDIRKRNPDADTLRALHRRSGMPLKRLFNTSGVLYRQMDLVNRLPRMTEEEQIALLSSDGMLVKRPLLIGEDFVLVGFKESEWEHRLQ